MYSALIFFCIHNIIKYLYPLQIRKHLIILFYVSVICWAVSQSVYSSVVINNPYCLPERNNPFVWVLMIITTIFDYAIFGTVGLMYFTLSLSLQTIAQKTNPKYMK